MVRVRAVKLRQQNINDFLSRYDYTQHLLHHGGYALGGDPVRLGTSGPWCPAPVLLAGGGMVSDSTASDSLVNRVTRAIFRSGPLLQVPNEAEDQARAAIRGVAEWLRENDSNCQMGGDAAVTADLLDAEANRFANE